MKIPQVEKPNYTQIPNVLLDSMFEFTHTEFKVLMLICRFTFGFHRCRHLMSLSFFERGCGLSRDTVSNCLHALAAKGVLSKEPDGDGFSYGLKIAEIEDFALVGNSYQSEIPTTTSRKFLPKKETVKETSHKGTKPTIEESKAKAAEMQMPESEGEKFFNYYQSKGWLVGKSPMKDWCAAMRNWKNHWLSYNKSSPRPKEDLISPPPASTNGTLQIMGLTFTKDSPPRREQFRAGNEGQGAFESFTTEWDKWVRKSGGAR